MQTLWQSSTVNDSSVFQMSLDVLMDATSELQQRRMNEDHTIITSDFTVFTCKQSVYMTQSSLIYLSGKLNVLR